MSGRSQEPHRTPVAAGSSEATVAVRLWQSLCLSDSSGHPGVNGPADQSTPGHSYGSVPGPQSPVSQDPSNPLRDPQEGQPLDHSVGTLALSLLNAIGEGVGLYSRAGAPIWSNDLLKGVTGAMHERVGWACRQFDRDHPSPPLDLPYPVPSVRSEFLLADLDRFFDVSISPLPRDTLTALGEGMRRWGDCLVVILRDVTAAKKLQQKINAIDLAGSELVRFDADVVRKYNAHERLKLLEEKIIRVARDLLHFDHFAIRLLDERTGKLELVIGYGLPAEFGETVIKPSLEHYGISGHVAASGRSYICSDTSRDQLYLPGVEGAKSSLTVPLRVHDKIIGIMNVESLQAEAFDEEDRQLGEIFGRYVAVAINLLDLLVVERSSTNQTITGRVAVELNEPLQDIAHEVEVLELETANAGPSTHSHLERIKRDLESIRNRIKECAAGPATLLGVEQALADKTQDPLLQGKRVLIADDEARIRRIIGDVLSTRGCTTTVCKDGGEAMAELEKAGAAGFDLIVSDIRMPDHNGYEIFAASHRLNPKAPVILMTGFGYDPHHSIVRASQEGLQSVLFKPFQVERLLDEVRKALKK
jgi:two-component system, sensor histidine kinase SagS